MAEGVSFFVVVDFRDTAIRKLPISHQITLHPEHVSDPKISGVLKKKVKKTEL